MINIRKMDVINFCKIKNLFIALIIIFYSFNKNRKQNPQGSEYLEGSV